MIKNEIAGIYDIKADADGVRLDNFLAQKIDGVSRSYIKKLIDEGRVKVNGLVTKPSYRIKKCDQIMVDIPEPQELRIDPEAIPLDILYEDDHIIAINKPQGMVVHPAPGNYSGTVVNALLYHCGNSLSGINGIIRPGIVHRLDKDTSGVMLVAKSNEAHVELAQQIKRREIKKIYNAIVLGNVKEEKGVIDAPIGRHPIDRKKMAVVEGGRNAITHFTVLERFGDYTYVEARIETGRTHQIRVHFAYIKHPVLGDAVYGPKRQPFNLKGQVLHAKLVGFVHPINKVYMEIEAPLPPYFEQLLQKLRRTSGFHNM
ncbi:RluA family pseudouridine synthase [Caldanaerobius polysaccharolyticus]|uniref:RluA family pseudouridine synthase n=1 Tax=Caldanaerobius polysaccharolyticus TaxID=44256 RepID=UPI00055047E5|nr:RluA family pseudouridine synthase [Caldanaerobius polysaccharolyticus]